jgi:hypothetical protein
MSVFPLNIVVKEDTPERLLALAGVPEKNKFLATDMNEVVAAIKELNGRALFITDGDGKEWFVRKTSTNLDTASFQIGDRLEAFVDEDMTEWIEGVIVGLGFTGVADLVNTSIFFKTNSQIRII